MQTITRDELKQKVDSGDDFLLIEVLGEESYNDFHLPGAINIPADETFKEQIQKAVPDKDKEVVLYCASLQCQASPRAAKWMDELGYTNVYDYEEGKADWKEAGLPTE